jgi:hypothetical protein
MTSATPAVSGGGDRVGDGGRARVRTHPPADGGFG